MLDVWCLHFNILTVDFQVQWSFILFSLLFTKFLHNTFEAISGWQGNLNFVFAALDSVLGLLADLIALFLVVSFPNLDKPFLNFGINELLIVKNLFEVCFGVIVQLKNEKRNTTMMKSSKEIPNSSSFSKKW